MDSRIINMCADVNACDCTYMGVYGHRKRFCAESWQWEKNPLLHQGIKPASVACQSNILPSELQPHPIPVDLHEKCESCDNQWRAGQLAGRVIIQRGRKLGGVLHLLNRMSFPSAGLEADISVNLLTNILGYSYPNPKTCFLIFL